jgi:hypothetical protein
MGLIREPLEVDFFVDPRPISEKEKKMISDFIKADKEKRKSKRPSKKGIYTKKAMPTR